MNNQASPSCPRPFSAATRRENMDILSSSLFDILVIGGGITGVSVARDAAMRGFRTALVEQTDFGWGTSSRSSRLVHGGLRYLEAYQLGLVFQCCSERQAMRRIAPRLVRPLPFLYPLYRGQKPAPWKLRAGLTLYDALSLFRNVQRHRWLAPDEVVRREPLLNEQGLLGAARFYDAQVDDARLTLAITRAAHHEGAVVANYAPVIGLLKSRQALRGAVIRDRIKGGEIEVQARAVINVTGVWADTVRQLDSTGKSVTVRPTKGSHLVLAADRLSVQHAVAFDSPRDGRHLFLIPWGAHVLLGTTDTDYTGRLDQPAAGRADVEYLLEALNHVFPAAQIGPEDVISSFAGLRPLLYGGGGSYALSREHHVAESDSGLINVVGGKLTTARLMAEQIVDRAARKLAREFAIHPDASCHSREPLPGGERPWVATGVEDQESHSHLVAAYGADAAWLLAYAEENPALGQRIAPPLPYLMAEALYAIQHEMALTLNDILIRRTHVIYEIRGGGLDRARAVAEAVAPRQGWGLPEIERQIDDYAAQVALTRAWEEE
ncbi:MAG: glycerol-3-phosphate dehydrogenase/oxidase [Anaerolineae bacterium]|nr:glycerol-3-phosphate dehydrogenase/oxidase [Anaerolineae bacterium]